MWCLHLKRLGGGRRRYGVLDLVKMSVGCNVHGGEELHRGSCFVNFAFGCFL